MFNSEHPHVTRERSYCNSVDKIGSLHPVARSRRGIPIATILLPCFGTICCKKAESTALKKLLDRLVLVLVFVPASLAAWDSPMFRVDPAHSGLYDAPGVPQSAKLKWKFKTGGGVFSSPAIVGGVLYVGSTDHFFYAINLSDGSLKWKVETASSITSSPAVFNGTVYFSNHNGRFIALDAETGKLKWRFQTDGERRYAATHLHGSLPAGEIMPDPFDFFLSSPTLWDGKVYFGSGDGNVYALDAATGALAWKFKTGDVVHASPAISDGTLYVGSWDSYFYALDAKTGTLKWRFKTGEDPDIHNQVGIQSSAVVSDGVVYFGCRDANLYALDAKTGEKKWAFNNKGSWVIGTPIGKDGKLYFTTSDSGLFYGVDAKTGTQVFSLKFVWPMFSSPAIARNTLYIGSHEGKFLAIDLSSQKLAWSFQTDGSRENGAKYTKPDGTPNYNAAFEDDFYDNMIIGVHRMLSVGTILSSPAVVGDAVYFGSSDGNVYALM
jgi:outer membrane protein assembly factor BamB